MNARSPHLLFLLMAAIWGSTWIPMKVGLSVLPPILFAAIRFVPAGLLLLAIAAFQGGGVRLARRDWVRVGAIALLMTTVSYTLMFWAMRYIRTGLAAVIDFTVTPVFLLGFALVLGEEAFHRRQALAIGLGAVGLFFLFLPSLFGGAPEGESLAALAIVLSVAAYCWGSVLARPLLRSYSSLLIAGYSNLAGGVVLLALSLAVEPGAVDALRLDQWTAAVWASWIALFLFGTVIASTIFLVLLREWGPSRAGSYAFVSPVIAVLEGMVVFQEQFGPVEAAGMAIMLVATYLALRRPIDISTAVAGKAAVE